MPEPPDKECADVFVVRALSSTEDDDDTAAADAWFGLYPGGGSTRNPSMGVCDCVVVVVVVGKPSQAKPSQAEGL